MKRNRSIPPATVVPVLVYPDVRAAVAWLTETFGFVERTRIGESHRAQPHDGAVTHLVRVRVEDVDAQFERASARGAHVLEPPIEREYGERDCTMEDLAGHRWQFAETLRDVAPEEFGCQTVEPWPLPSNT